MAVKIRLARTGRKKIARYRIVVADTRFKRDGRFIEAVGFYNPQAIPKQFSINAQRVNHWIGCGAQLSETVNNLLIQDNFKQKAEAIKRDVALESMTIERKGERKRKPKAKEQKTEKK
ncbi:MAG: 30S ribosomal protein S16 [Chitinivibrionales bacterium]|nr:30S ribosomal protein S16 [Chitinivibrionales bacterium]